MKTQNLGSDMDNHLISSIVGYVTIALSATWAWVGQNDSQITSMCAILGLILAAYGTYRKKN